MDSSREQLMTAILGDPKIRFDPVAFTMFAYPWGMAGTPLAQWDGPKAWQLDTLKYMRDFVHQQHERANLGLPFDLLRDATVSGRGIGKTAELGMDTHWFRSAFPGGTCIVSANSEPQLRTRTMPELKKWATMAINADWFVTEALSILPAPWFAKIIAAPLAEGGLATDTSYYYTRAQLWQEENPDNYAGAHSQIAMMLVFDEASGIPKPIFPVAAGYFTDNIPYRFWLMRSNGRRNVGGFYDAFHPEPGKRKQWRTRHIDSRTVEGADLKFFADMVEEYGEDSDTVRVEVRGLFPRQGDRQFISGESVTNARLRPLRKDPGAPLIMGVDVARYGTDNTVVRFRQGPDGRSFPSFRWRGLDTVTVADRVEKLMIEHDPDAVCIDTALGGPVCDILKRRGRRRVYEINFGARSSDDNFANKRAEMYNLAKKWLHTGCLDDNYELAGDLTSPTYEVRERDQKIVLQDKEELRAELGRSPDEGDAFVLTHAVNPPRRDLRERAFRSRQNQGLARGVDFDPIRD